MMHTRREGGGTNGQRKILFKFLSCLKIQIFISSKLKLREFDLTQLGSHGVNSGV